MDGFPKKGADRKRGLQILLEVAQNLRLLLLLEKLSTAGPGMEITLR